MKRIAILSAALFALAAVGCAGPQARGEKPITKQTHIKCPKCGVEFTVGEGLNALEKGR
ncbi:hypothetical protein [Deferrisoma sp.]